MPCYLFTYHTHGSWLPDRPQGYVRKHEGILPQDKQLARLYRNLMTQGEVSLAEEIQLVAIQKLLEAGPYIDCRVHAVVTDEKHIHLITSWHDTERGWMQTRSSFKKSLTIGLKASHDAKRWLSRGASRKQVNDRLHFDYLVNSYLPNHRGWKWDERVGYYNTMEELQQRLSDDT